MSGEAYSYAGLSEYAEADPCRLLRLKDQDDLYVLEDEGNTYDSLFRTMASSFTAGGSFLHRAVLLDGTSPLIIQAAATKAESLKRGEEPAFAGQLLRIWLYEPGEGAREGLELKRTREYTKIHKIPPSSTWPGLRVRASVPPLDPGLLGYLRALAKGVLADYGTR